MNAYEGWLSLAYHGEADDVLFLSSLHDPLAEELEEISGKQVTVRYWVTGVKVSKEEAKSGFLNEMLGMADVRFNVAYSEVTGYLWTDEDLNIGGHDLLEELKGSVGEYLILEIEVH